MKNCDTKYKGLNFRQNSDLNYLELIVNNEVFFNNESYILSISIMVEYACYIRPKYLVINKLNSDFKLNKELFKFTQNGIFKPLKDAGVERVIMLVNDSLYKENYSNIEPKHSFMIAFTSIDDINKWIAENCSNKYQNK